MESPQNCDLSELTHFAQVLARNLELFTRPQEETLVIEGSLYCSSKQCCGYRRVHIDYNGPLPPQAIGEVQEESAGHRPRALLKAITPSTFSLTCQECDAEYTAVVYNDSGESSLLVLAVCGRGIATPHTPDSVAYYLDQADRSHSAGANSAALAMLRAAIEWILYDAGYSNHRMLGPKLSALDADLKGGEGPLWARQIHPDVLTVLKQLGDTAIHTNDGEISAQELMDASLYRAAEATLMEVLDFAYERPKTLERRMSLMKSVIPSRKNS